MSEGRDLRSFNVAVTALKQRLSANPLRWEHSIMLLQNIGANTIYIGGEDEQLFPIYTKLTPIRMDNIDPYYIFCKGTAADTLSVLMIRKKLVVIRTGK